MKILAKAWRNVTHYVGKIDELDDDLIEKVISTAAEKALVAAVLGAERVEFSCQAVIGVHMFYDNGEALRQLPKIVCYPPRNLTEIRNMIELAAPEQLRIYATAGLSLGVSVTAMVGMTWNKNTLLKNWDSIVAELR